ncbi:response regulator [Arvimicrobium flavum]|uniref:response regulator n=1 Tax=Arvimicrobium flavum TaxID=3393320 RepID=UPI00237ABBD0|nr:response regulator [Mesorhizobium shangrilense]
MSLPPCSQDTVVEDEPLIRMDLAAVLEEMGFSVLEAANADEAIAMPQSDPATRTVITDVDVPGTMDGLALTFLVRDRWPPCHLIVSGPRRPKTSGMAEGGRFIR